MIEHIGYTQEVKPFRITIDRSVLAKNFKGSPKMKSRELIYHDYKKFLKPKKPTMLFATDENGVDLWQKLERCDPIIFMPTDVCRDKDGNPILAAPEFHWHKENENTISPVAGTPVTITITKKNYNP